MTPKKANEIMNKVVKEWIRIHGVNRLDPVKIKAVMDMLLLSPHEDGFMRVEVVEREGVYLVPFEDIILYGLKGEEIVNKYEKEKQN